VSGKELINAPGWMFRQLRQNIGQPGELWHH
jgi:hypothetical protein